jgi:hypothetical protein
MLGSQTRYAEAVVHCQRALDLLTAAGDLAGQGRALNALGWYHAMLGEHRLGLRHRWRALAVQEQAVDLRVR